jgi:transposase
LVAIDLAKSVFHVEASDAADTRLWERRLRRDQFAKLIGSLAPTEIAMEACATAHHWGRQFTAKGHKVRLIPPPAVARLVDRRKKNDRRDTRAIRRAARDEDVRPVPLKSTEDQAEQFEHRVREQWVCQRTATINQVRAMLAEFGIVLPKGESVLLSRRGELLADERLAGMDRLHVLLRAQFELLERLSELIDEADRRLRKLAKTSPVARRLITIPGVGPVISTGCVAAIADPKVFRCGRDFSAWMGIVPSQHSTGGKVQLGPITKRGSRYLRANLVHGARSLLSSLSRSDTEPTDGLLGWAKSLLGRMHWNKAVVAIANKLARIIWALMANGGVYRPRPAWTATRGVA